eukprot:GEMP01053313.1.p1 GENE.GEMP01053313.1~~GEMP01053313.1.p1  ORF type:complete len:229 (+),score=-18.21 GEMP01053313.1:199-885(+)
MLHYLFLLYIKIQTNLYILKTRISMFFQLLIFHPILCTVHMHIYIEELFPPQKTHPIVTNICFITVTWFHEKNIPQRKKPKRTTPDDIGPRSGKCNNKNDVSSIYIIQNMIYYQSIFCRLPFSKSEYRASVFFLLKTVSASTSETEKKLNHVDAPCLIYRGVGKNVFCFCLQSNIRVNSFICLTKFFVLQYNIRLNSLIFFASTKKNKNAERVFFVKKKKVNCLDTII